jgi:hypothetical protein
VSQAHVDPASLESPSMMALLHATPVLMSWISLEAKVNLLTLLTFARFLGGSGC